MLTQRLHKKALSIILTKLLTRLILKEPRRVTIILAWKGLGQVRFGNAFMNEVIHSTGCHPDAAAYDDESALSMA